MRLRRISSLIFALLATQGIHAQAQGNTRPLFIPNNYYVGDRVEMRVSLPSNERLSTERELPDIPPLGWGVVHDARIQRGPAGSELRVQFTPYLPGTHAFPPLSIGDQPLGEIQIFVNSVLEDQVRELRTLRNQTLLPGTISYLVAQILILGLAVFSGVLVLRLLVPRVLAAIALYKIQEPFRQFFRVFSFLVNNRKLHGQEVYRRLGQEFRLYLERRSGHAAIAATTRELIEILEDLEAHHELIEQVRVSLVHGDAVLYGGEAVDATEVHAFALLIEGLVRELEESFLNKATQKSSTSSSRQPKEARGVRT